MTGKRTILSGGTVATDTAVLAADVVIEGSRISGLTEHGAIMACDERIDVSGLFLLPGAIDPHAHFEDPGHTEREDFTTGTMSAAAGGITTVIEHPLTYPPVTTAQLYIEKREMAKRKVVVDFGLWGALTEPSIPEIAAQWREGAAGFKAFMPFSEPGYPHVTDAQFLEGMYAVREVGGLVLVHAESDSLLQAGLARMHAAGRKDPLAHHESRPPFVEEEAVHRALFLAEHADVRIQIVHVSSPGSAALVRRAKDAGQRGLDGDLPAPPAARPRRPRAPRARTAAAPLRCATARSSSGSGTTCSTAPPTRSSRITPRTRSRRRSRAGPTSSPPRSAAR